MNSKELRTTEPRPGLQHVQQLSAVPLSPQQVEIYQKQFDSHYESAAENSQNPPKLKNPGTLSGGEMASPKSSISTPGGLPSGSSEPKPEIQPPGIDATKPPIGEKPEPEIQPPDIDATKPPIGEKPEPEIQEPHEMKDWTWEEILKLKPEEIPFYWPEFTPEQQRMYLRKLSDAFVVQLATQGSATTLEAVKQAFREEEQAGQ